MTVLSGLGTKPCVTFLQRPGLAKPAFHLPSLLKMMGLSGNARSLLGIIAVPLQYQHVW